MTQVSKQQRTRIETRWRKLSKTLEVKVTDGCGAKHTETPGFFGRVAWPRILHLSTLNLHFAVLSRLAAAMTAMVGCNSLMLDFVDSFQHDFDFAMRPRVECGVNVGNGIIDEFEDLCVPHGQGSVLLGG